MTAHHPTEVRNYYELIGPKYITPQTRYKNYDRFKIDLPARFLICGKTGSGKTNLLLNLVFDMGCFTRIFLCAKNLEEPLYRFLIDEIQKVEKRLKKVGEIIFITSDIEDLPSVDEFDKRYVNLVIIDDQINETSKVLKRVTELFTRGRKHNISCAFLTQSYTDTPKTLRKNCSVFIFKDLLRKDLQLIMRDFSMTYTIGELMKMYNSCHTKDVNNFFMIDTTKNDGLMYRHNFEAIEVESPS